MKKIKLVTLVFLSIIISILIGFGVLEDFEHLTYDSLLSESNENTNDVIIVGIDDESIAQLGRYPWDRDVYATLVDNLAEGGVAAVGFDIIFSELQGVQDDVFAESIGNTDSVILASTGELSGEVSSSDEGNALLADYFYYPNDVLLEGEPTVGFINTLTDSDNVVRKALPYIYNMETGEFEESFNYQIYKKYALKNGIEPVELQTSYFRRPYINYVGSAGSIETVPFSMVYNKEIPPEYFENKIVLVGMMASGGQDIYYTSAGPMYGVEIHANFINNMLLGNYKVDLLKDHITYITSDIYVDITKILVALIVALLYVFMTMRVNKNSIKAIISGGFIVFCVIAQYVLFYMGYIFYIIYPIIVVILLFLVDMAIDFYVTQREKRKITNIFNKYMSKELVSKIVSDGEESIKLGGDKRHIAVMFIDIRGFTTISESLEPEKVVVILNEYLSMATERIISNNGVLDKYIGDGIMALFNVPYDMENPEYACIKCAFEIKQNSKALYDKLHDMYGLGVEFGIGINCGAAIVGNIGSDMRMDYTAIGDNVNTAARLESNAKRGQILISEVVYKKVEDRVEVNFVGDLKVKGKEITIATYEVVNVL